MTAKRVVIARSDATKQSRSEARVIGGSGDMPLGSIEDRLAINDLFVRYTTALDRGDVETIVDCFTPDGSLDSPAVGSHSGHAAIRTFAERFAAFNKRGSQLRHVISNLAAKIDGD